MVADVASISRKPGSVSSETMPASPARRRGRRGSRKAAPTVITQPATMSHMVSGEP